MSPDHPLFEDLSAHHDGEAPEWAEHLAGCESCQARLGELAALSQAVAHPSPPRLPADDRDDPVARAVTAAGPEGGATGTADPFGHGAGTPFGHAAGTPFGHAAGSPAEPRRKRNWMLAASTAAVITVSIAVGAVVASKGPHREMTRDAFTQQRGGPAADGGSTRQGSVVVAGYLGEIPDRAALVARVDADLEAEEQRRAARAAPAPAPAPAAEEAPAVPDSSLPTAGAANSAPCESETRADPGDRGELIYRATADEGGTPAVVLAFRSAQGSDAITVEMLALSDCRLLLRGAIL